MTVKVWHLMSVNPLNIFPASLVHGFFRSPPRNKKVMLWLHEWDHTEKMLSDGYPSCLAGAQAGAESGSRVNKVCGHGTERTKLAPRGGTLVSLTRSPNQLSRHRPEQSLVIQTPESLQHHGTFTLRKSPSIRTKPLLKVSLSFLFSNLSTTSSLLSVPLGQTGHALLTPLALESTIIPLWEMLNMHFLGY